VYIRAIGLKKANRFKCSPCVSLFCGHGLQIRAIGFYKNFLLFAKI
jgi:hypothetical protein